MIDILGEEYYIDFEAIDDFLIIKRDSDKLLDAEITTFYDENDEVVSKQRIGTERDRPIEINTIKFELVKGFIDDLGYNEDDNDNDPMLGAVNIGKMSLRFKLAFNTLTNYGILKIK